MHASWLSGNWTELPERTIAVRIPRLQLVALGNFDLRAGAIRQAPYAGHHLPANKVSSLSVDGQDIAIHAGKHMIFGETSIENLLYSASAQRSVFIAFTRESYRDLSI